MAKRVLKIHDNSVEAINRMLSTIQEQLEGLHDRPSFNGDINMNGRRITNVGRTEGRFDVAPRAELEDKALFENSQGQHVAKSTVLVPGGIRTNRRARENHDLVPLGQVKELIGSPAGAVLTTGDQAISGYKSFDKICFPRQQVNLNDGLNLNVILGASAKTMLQIAGPTHPFQIDGIADGSTASGWTPVDGRLLILVNITGQPMTIVNATHSLASAINVINTNATGGADYTTIGSGMVMLLRVQVANAWYIIGQVN